jgi:hypothetical protein
MIDTLALLAIGAFGWGLSLATYRFFAQQYGWPMGDVQWDLPQLPALLGILSLLAGLLFAAMRGSAEGGIVIVAFGLLLALFWTGFLRVAAQTALFLAPLAGALLLVGWLSGPGYPRYGVELDVQHGYSTRDQGALRGD